ncbi:MAG: amidohydrolase [Armatimonadetes bacterium]|nr:amidohydrolase [Armatimonadota bacterium]MDE2205557.1 amidohydrolase [Armatimonadota bacterium]
MSETAHKLFHGARFTTFDPEAPVASALAVDRGGMIMAAGTAAELQGLCTADTQYVHLGDRWATPGFFDCHLHMLGLGLYLFQVDLRPPETGSVDEIVRKLTERLHAEPDSKAVLGNRYDQNRMRERRHPTRHDLDRVATDRPVRVEHTSGHAAVVNSCGLRLLGIGASSPDPTGGEIVRDERGEPTGVLLETAAWNNMERIVPPATREQAVDALSGAAAYLLQRGITSAGDAATAPDEVAWYAAAAESRVLGVRVNLMMDWPAVCRQSAGDDAPKPAEMWNGGPEGEHWLHIGQAKLFSDGAITTRTCWLNEPFADSGGNCGLPLHPPDVLKEYIFRAHRAGWQIATHAIGDRAIDLVLRCYAEAQRAHRRPNPGHRIEHCMLLTDDLISRLRRQRVWSIGQPEFLHALGDAYVAALGEKRATLLSPYASLRDRGVLQAFSSDCPVVPGAPLDGIRAAMQRATHSGRILNTEERIDAETAFRLYTVAAAAATLTHKQRGNLARGRAADFTVFTADPFATPAAEWEQVQVAATVIGGEVRFAAKHVDLT